MKQSDVKHFGKSHSFRYAILAAVYSGMLVLLTFLIDRYLGLQQTTLFLLLLSPILFSVIGFIIGHKEDLYREAIFHSNKDFMTGLPNHSNFQQRLLSEINRARRCDKKVALLKLDLDHFKRVNDDFGHQKGDEVLQLVGSFLNENIRPYDMAARYGGEEFVVIMPEIKSSDAVAVADRLREQLADLAEDAGLPDGYITASIGVADYPACAPDAAGVISAANCSLQYAKRKGRNRVTYFRNLENIKLLENFELRETDFDLQKRRLQSVSYDTLKDLVETVFNLDLHPSNLKFDRLATDLAVRLGMDNRQREMLVLTLKMNDIGRLGVHGPMLHKGALSKKAEKSLLQLHPEMSEQQAREVVQIQELFAAIRYHHEHWDGTGYPEELKGEDIPMTSRAAVILESYGSMVSNRHNHQAMAESQAIAELCEGSGSKFDKKIVAALIEQLHQENYEITSPRKTA